MKLIRPASLLILAALLPLIALSAALGAAWMRQQQHTMEEDALDRVERLSGVLEREIASQTRILDVLAQSPHLDGPVNEVPFFELARRIHNRVPLWISILLSSPDGTRLVDAPRLVAGVPGKVVDMESHSLAVEGRRPVIGGIVVGPRGRPAFAIRVPVVRNDRVSYVLSAVVDPVAFREYLFAEGIPPGWIVAVVDSGNNLVARTSGSSSFIGRSASESARSARARGGHGIYEGATLEGVQTVVAYRMIPGSLWSVHVAIPRDAYRAPLVRAAWLLAGGGSLSLALVAVLLWQLARELRHRRLEETAREGGVRLEALGRLTGGVAHDFNNLLMVVQGAAEMIKRRKGSPEQVDRVADSLLSTAERGAALTRQLLAFARRGTHEPAVMDLRESAPDLFNLLNKLVRSDISVTVSVPEGTWPVYVDPNALEVALINLAVNARDAMPDGGSLSVEGRNVFLQGRRAEAGLEGDYVALTVTDTGEGIREEHLGRIFEPFFTTKPSGKGTGLGLSQVFGFAKQSGGAVTVASKPGEGTIFTLYLPRSARRPAPRASAGQVPPAADEGHVLLVEDNAEVAHAVKEMLASAGYEVTWADGAATALDIIDRGRHVHAVLSDIVMEGGMSGLDLAPLIRRRRPALPIVLMTGYSEALARGEQSGFTVLSKPFSQKDVAAALRSAMRRGADPAGGAAAPRPGPQA
jgi:signal transduction histidine kinase/ActR/RegA family two-component response regulator